MAGRDDGVGDGAPVAELDPRFGEAGAEPTPWADALGILERAEVAWLTTVSPGARPHVTPLMVVVVGGAVRFCTGADEQKARNLGRSSAVALTTGVNVLEGGCDVVVLGDASRVADPVEVARTAPRYEEKYGVRWSFTADGVALRGGAGDLALLFEVVPREAFAFAKGPYGQTRYRFAAG